jgi:fluoride exporter
MGKTLLAGIGGFAGSALRFVVAGLVQNWSGSFRFPFGTLAVNLAGCLVIGFLSQLAETRGFTTFSAFGNETINLWRDGESMLAAANIAAHLVLCLGAVWLSRALAYQIWA